MPFALGSLTSRSRAHALIAAAVAASTRNFISEANSRFSFGAGTDGDMAGALSAWGRTPSFQKSHRNVTRNTWAARRGDRAVKLLVNGIGGRRAVTEAR